MFRKRKGIKLSYARQGLIYFTCLNYAELAEEEQHRILNICAEVGGEYYPALFALMTSGENITKTSMEYYISETILYGLRRKFYEKWYEKWDESPIFAPK